jgi:putative ABC transport system permease protein
VRIGATDLTGLDERRAIAVRGEPGVDGGLLRDRIGAAVGSDPQVLDHRHAATADAGDPSAFDRVELVAVLAAGGGITLAITIFVVAGTIAFGVERRRRELALLRAVGATPGQVRRLLAGETALIGLVAGAAGSLAATALFAAFSDSLVSVGLAPDGFEVAPHWIPYAIAVAVGVVVALLATLIAGRRALAVSPGEALVESALPQPRSPGSASGPPVVFASLAGAGSDPDGGPLVIPWDQAGLVIAGAAAIGLIGTLVPAALVGRARLTALAGLRE